MTRRDEELLPTETIAAVIYALTRRRSMSTQEAADVGCYTYHSADLVLQKASRTVPIAKTGRGEWAIVDEVSEAAERVRPVLRRLRDELHATPHGAAFCHPLKRVDVATLVHALEVFLHESA